MTDVVEISSDSNDTVIETNHENDDVEDIVKKYISDNCSESEDLDFTRIKKPKTCIDVEFCTPSMPENEANTLEELAAKYRTISQKALDKQRQKQEKETLRKQKLEERELKKKEAEQERLLKQAVTAANKNVQPNECMKFVCVQIDNKIMSEKFSCEITGALENADVKFTIGAQIFPHTITWSRIVQTHVIDNDAKLVSSSNKQDTDHVLVIMKAKEFIEHVETKTLSTQIAFLKSITTKCIILIVFGLHKYCRQLSKKRIVSKTSIEYALTEIQLSASCSHRLVETGDELGQTVLQFTKSIAQIPFKQQRRDKQADWYVGGDNRDCVKVDKDGNGLNRLWNQTLTTFPLARLETAEAISSQYPTVSSLFTAYESCPSHKNAELLLKEIPIRRAAGPLSSTRRIGPELSKKIYNFFTSLDGNALL